jgi:hypothetical protein
MNFSAVMGIISHPKASFRGRHHRFQSIDNQWIACQKPISVEIGLTAPP